MIENGIAVIGSTTIDEIISRGRCRLKIGGVTTYSGITYSRHGIRTSVVTNVAGHDRDLVKRLQAQQITVFNGRTPVTTHFIHGFHAGKQKQKVSQCAESINHRQVAENLNNIGAVHLGPLHASDIDLDAILPLAGLRCFVILDIQGYTRAIQDKSVCLSVSKQLPPVLRLSQIVKANQMEYEAVLDFFRMDLTTIMNQHHISEFIVTSGKKGGFVQKISGEKIRYKAAEIHTVADSIGAGDIFLAAYVIGRFMKRQSIRAACKYAAKLAASQIGGRYIQLEDLGLDHREENQL
jgi:sugar/nucleoside kinase (ribokinase family)